MKGRRKPQHHNHGGRRALIAISSMVAAALLSLAVILWLTLRPSNPSFSLLAATATVDYYNASATTIVVDAALTVHNPNAHATALYDRLRASASYGGAPPLPPLLASQGDAVLMSSWRSSSWRSAGGRATLLRVRVEGQLRWKVAIWVSGRHGLIVDCVAAVVLVPSSSSVVAGQQQRQGSSSQCASYI